MIDIAPAVLIAKLPLAATLSKEPPAAMSVDPAANESSPPGLTVIVPPNVKVWPAARASVPPLATAHDKAVAAELTVTRLALTCTTPREPGTAAASQVEAEPQLPLATLL